MRATLASIDWFLYEGNTGINKLNDTLHLTTSGQGGYGYSVVINALLNLLQGKCEVTSIFGIAAFNITLHSFLKLSIRAKNCCDFWEKESGTLQDRLKDIKYIVIDKFSHWSENAWLDWPKIMAS